MMEINIDPTMLVLGPLVISWHGFFSAVGLGFGIWLTARSSLGSCSVLSRFLE